MTDYPDPSPAKPLWLVTLADLALLLVGFLVLVQATARSDRGALAHALRDAFAEQAPAPPMPVAAEVVGGFAPGSATAPSVPAGLVGWAREAIRDPRVRLTITGRTDGSPADVDPVSGSATILAAGRAAHVAALLTPAIPADRLTIATDPGPGRRAATVTIGFAGDIQKER